MRLAWATALLLAAFFVFFAVGAGRIGVAVAGTPWGGRFRVPAPRIAHADAYRAALDLVPGFVPLRYPHVRARLALFRSLSGEARRRARGGLDEAIAALRATDPRDFQADWLAAAVAEEEGRYGRAAELLERGIAWAPTNFQLRDDFIRIATGRLLARMGVFDPDRLVLASRIAGHIRGAARLRPYMESGFIDLFEQAGGLAPEIVAVWPEGQPGSHMKRARYWIRQQRWDLAEIELVRAEACDDAPVWVWALHGRVSLERLEVERGVRCWREALERLSPSRDGDVGWWLEGEVRGLPDPVVTRIVEDLLDVLPGFPGLAVAAGERLMARREWALADRLLSASNRRKPTPEGFRCWADLALKLEDREAALARARQAWELSDRGPNWDRWYDAFVKCWGK